MNNYIDSIKKLQIELSNFCNASCIGCRRTDHRTLTEKYELYSSPKTFLTLDVIHKLLESKYFADLEEVEFCGTIDEPLAHQDFLEILQMLFNFNPYLLIRRHTNGAIRNVDFYKKLAQSLRRFDKHELRFSIDGLEESHRLYRGDLDYNKIMENAKSFINAGGHAAWQMLQFPWNENEVETCNELAKQMGFKKFAFRRDRTHASQYSPEFIKEKRQINEPAPPKAEPAELIIHPELSEINCHYRNESMMFLNHQSRLFPCCFMANMEITRLSDLSLQYKKHVIEKYGEDFNNLQVKSVDEVLESLYYKNDLVESFSHQHHDEVNPKMLVCTRSCGKKAPPVANHIKVEEMNDE